MVSGRQLWVTAHRWAGLSIAFFLVITGATGALMPFYEPLDRFFAADFHTGSPVTVVNPARLHCRAEALSGGTAESMPLRVEPGATAVFSVSPRPGQPPLGFDEIAVDPVTGAETGRRTWGDISEGRINLMPFLYRLHYSLALDSWGSWILGIAALIWTIDCFVGFALTVPTRRPGWLGRWRKAWGVRTGSWPKLEFDLHRATGLWLWPILLLFAWSSVGFNLNPVFSPVMTAALGSASGGYAEQAALDAPRLAPRLGWQQALARARQLTAETAARRGFRVTDEVFLNRDSDKGLYIYGFRSDRDVHEKFAGARLAFDSDSGALRYLTLPTGDTRRSTMETWLFGLHMAAIGGLPVRIAVSLIGLAIVGVSVTGVLIWMRRRRAQLWHNARSGSHGRAISVTGTSPISASDRSGPGHPHQGAARR